MTWRFVSAGVAAAIFATSPALAADKVIVGYAPGAASLPFFVAQDQGFFAAEDIEIEPVVLNSSSLIQSSLVANQLDVAAGLLAVEGMTANIAKPGSVSYIALNAQNATHRMEQFVARAGFPAKTLADFKGARLVTAPGAGNVTFAKAALALAGLKEGDYVLDQMDVNQHINVLKSGQYDGAYTLEPGGTTMNVQGVGTTIQAGIIAEVVLGDANANAYMNGTALSMDFREDRPEVAARFAKAWAEAIDFIETSPVEARESLLGHTIVPPELAQEVPLVKFTMVADTTDEDRRNFQAYVDYAVAIGTIPRAVDAAPYFVVFP